MEYRVEYQERCLRTELASWLGVGFDDSYVPSAAQLFSRRLLDTACRWCSGKGIGKFTDIRDTDAVSAFAKALSLDPSDPRLLQLPSNFEDEVESPGCTCGGIPKAAIERLLRDELASWLEVGLGKSWRLDTACRWCSDQGIKKLRHIWEFDVVSELADTLSLSHADPRVLRLQSKREGWSPGPET